ncbi:MAG: ATP-dependent helicase [Oscillospiraceae bacterium]|uniref:ATP-dependent helicase n=1 Tax=Oscillibacter ruminantium TaxID=1263547 RepID=UPI0003072377|nr:ATP-dependent helicase [Oscillibacter ruminantium]MDD3228907.1 ATP-dependent helicase [Oscillospiraceae bacterium]
MHLSPDQQRAVDSHSKYIAIIAGAGSGKTLVLTERIARMIDDDPSAATKILALTFTAKAAGEMKRRLNKKLGPAASKLSVKTFHSFGLEIIRLYPYYAGLQEKFEVAGGAVRAQYAKQIIKQKKISGDPKEILGKISAIKGMNGPCPPEFAGVFYAYNDMLRAANQIDIDDMIWLPVNMLQTHADIREALHAKFEHILIDEYQDTNDIQNSLVELSMSEVASLCIVGDDDQCIYEWRGSRPNYIRDFAQRDDVEKIVLAENYRSQKNVVTLANQFISHNQVRIEKEMTAKLRALAPPEFYRLKDASDEAQLISGIIDLLCKENTYSYSDVAILVRSSKQAPDICDALAAHGIPYSRRQDSANNEFLSFFCVLYSILNPKSTTNLSKAINYPSTVLDNFTFMDLAEDNGWDKLPVPEVFNHLANGDASWLQQAEFAKRFLKLRDLSQRVARDENTPVLSILTELLEFYRDQGIPQGSNIQWLEQTIAIASEWESNAENPSLSAFIDYVSCATANEEELIAPETKDKVSVMTCHKSKGLEFPIVFIPGVQVGCFPNDFFIQSEMDVEAERRLLYVAMTRAKERLYVSSFENPYGSPENCIVRQGFVAEMPLLMEWRRKRREALKLDVEPPADSFHINAEPHYEVKCRPEFIAEKPKVPNEEKPVADAPSIGTETARPNLENDPHLRWLAEFQSKREKALPHESEPPRRVLERPTPVSNNSFDRVYYDYYDPAKVQPSQVVCFDVCSDCGREKHGLPCIHDL